MNTIEHCTRCSTLTWNYVSCIQHEFIDGGHCGISVAAEMKFTESWVIASAWVSVVGVTRVMRFGSLGTEMSSQVCVPGRLLDQRETMASRWLGESAAGLDTVIVCPSMYSMVDDSIHGSPP